MVKQLILDRLEGRGWVAGGILEDCVRDSSGHKASTASRMLRAMEEDGLLLKKYEKPEKGHPFVLYKIKAKDKLF